jgi:hypothetical protein
MDRLDPIAAAMEALPLQEAIDVVDEARLLRALCGVAIENGRKQMRPAAPREGDAQLAALYT